MTERLGVIDRREADVAAWGALVEQLQEWEQNLEATVAEVYPERAGEAAANVFPVPTQPRAEAADPDLDARQEAALRRGAARFGIGGEADVTTNADVEVIEAGKPWKVEAEQRIATGRKVYAATPHRNIGQDEVAYMRGRIADAQGLETAEEVPAEVVPQTEYDMVCLLAALEPGFTLSETDEALPYGYDIHNKFALINEPTGQLVRIGTDAEGRDVLVLRVDQENYVDEGGASKYRNRPQAADVVRIVSGVLREQGDATSSIGFNTSNTYADRAIRMTLVGLDEGRQVSVGMYGRATLADVRGEAVASPTPINQLPGEMHVVAEQLAGLRAELGQRRVALQSPLERRFGFDPARDLLQQRLQRLATGAVAVLERLGLARPVGEQGAIDSGMAPRVGDVAVGALLKHFRTLGR